MSNRYSVPRPIFLITLALGLLLSACSEPLPEDLLERSRHTPPWFDDAKLGIFIHWGPASVPAFAAGKALEPGELEEVLLGSGRQELPYAEWYPYVLARPDSATAAHHKKHYGDAPYSDFGEQFEARVEQSWDPDAWAELFAQAGARYVVLVTKHHDGYTLWPSDVENPHAPSWGSELDMVGALATAVRDRGMRFGTYYSTGLDWTFKLVSEGDLVRDVMRSAPGDKAYGEYAQQHIRELTDRYKPDVMWADIGYPSEGGLAEVLGYYFEHVPDGVVNDRWAAVDTLGTLAEIPGAAAVMKFLGRLLTRYGADPLEDDPARIGFKTAEYASLPGIPPYKWEATRGLGGSFAFNAAETADDMLSAEDLVTFLVDTVAKNGNVLINVGPDSYGTIPDIQQAPLLGLGEWLAVNGESVYGTQPWQRYHNERGRELRYTTKGDTLYAIVYGAVGNQFTIENPGIVWRSLQVLGAQVSSVDSTAEDLTITLSEPLEGPAAVVRFTLAGPVKAQVRVKFVESP